MAKVDKNKKIKRYFIEHFGTYLASVLFLLIFLSSFWYPILKTSVTLIITLLSGILIFLGGQLIMQVIIEPILEVRRTIGKIAYTLKYYANIYARSFIDEKFIMEAVNETRKLSCELEANYNAVLYKNLPEWALPSRASIALAAKNLIYLSNNTGIKNLELKKEIPQNYIVIEEIKELLSIKPLYDIA